MLLLRRVIKGTAWTFVLVSTVLAIAPSTMAQPRAMIADGVYRITIGRHDTLLSAGPRPGSRVALLPPRISAYQEWHIEPNGDAYTIRNVPRPVSCGWTGHPWWPTHRASMSSGHTPTSNGSWIGSVDGIADRLLAKTGRTPGRDRQY